MFVARPRFELELNAALDRSPAAVMLGPRQIGKTTLARQVATQRGALYLDLERPADLRSLADADAFLRRESGRLIVLDEVHRLPDLFAQLRGAIDERRRMGARTGQFLLLGSASLDLIQRTSESLAGRVAYLELGPISPREASGADIGIERVWTRGGFPESLLAPDEGASLSWRQDFVRSYLERDVPMFAARLPALLIGRLWTMLAHNQGQLLNAARLARALGVTAPSIVRYVDLLVDLLLVRRLTPWSGNLGKRLVRAPKLYIRDCGLLHALLEIRDLQGLLGHPVVGESWEGLVIETLIASAGGAPRPFFYRTHDGAEIDLVFERAGLPWLAVEIKRSSAPKARPGFHTACDDLAIARRWLVAPVDRAYPGGNGVEVMPLTDAAQRLEAEAG